MLKQSSSRNQRSKEFKVKHALQICLLLAVCIWLLYQVKQTYQKKLALEESSRTDKLRNDYKILKLGRKGLDPQQEEIVADSNRRQDEKTGRMDKLGESEGNKIGVVDDEIDGQDQEKAEEEEPDQLEDLIDEDDVEGDGNVETDSYSEDVDLINNQHRSGVERNSEAAKEETLRRRC